MVTENEVQPDGVVGDSPQQVLQAARNIIEADTADMEECGQNGGCGKDHADEVAHGEAVIKRIDRVINDPALGVPDDLTVALLYGDFCEADYAASWLEPTEQVVDEFEAWLPGAVAERMGSDTVREYLPRLKEVYGRAVKPPDERSKAAQACEYLAAQPESHWTEDVRLEGDEDFGEDEYGNEDRVRYLMDHQGDLLGVQIADYTDAGYGYLDTFVGTVNVLVKDGVVSRKVDPEFCGRVDAHHTGRALWIP